MARKTLTFTVQDEGRDKGKTFIITEMAASQAEKWAIRAFLAMAQAGIQIPDEIAEMGFAGLAKIGLDSLAKLPYVQVEPLMDEMMRCVQIMPNPSQPGVVRALVEDDIEEISTRIKLKPVILQLHAGFSGAGSISTSAQPSA